MSAEPSWPTSKQEAAWRAELDRMIESGCIRFRTDPAPEVHEPGMEHISGPLGRFLAGWCVNEGDLTPCAVVHHNEGKQVVLRSPCENDL